MSLRSGSIALVSVAVLLAGILTFNGCRTNGGAELRDAETPVATATGTGTGSEAASGSAALPTATPPKFPPGSACERACADHTKNEDWAVCYSCQCKAAFDNYLPTAAELSCARGPELKIFRMNDAGGEPRLEQVTTDVAECLNPDRLREDGAPGSRMVQIVHNDVIFKTICKREVFIPDFRNPSIPVAFATVKKCCADPAATGCEWEDIPMLP